MEYLNFHIEEGWNWTKLRMGERRGRCEKVGTYEMGGGGGERGKRRGEKRRKV